MRKRIAILGSTGSIGTQALNVIEQHSDMLEAYVLTAGKNAALLIEQARKFRPYAVVIADEQQYDTVQEALADLPIQVYAGEDAICQIVDNSLVDQVLVALVGFSGLRPTLNAIRARKPIALANKETLVVAGQLVTGIARELHVPIIPVDSEHSAILQSLTGEDRKALEKILLTASGGPFRTFTAEQLSSVTPSDALKHPQWTMGAKITIDSATLMNKGFEMIEACWLFDVRPCDIEIVIHPESVIHSAVQFRDGAVKAQLGVPDMRIPILYAFTYPKRLTLDCPRLDLISLHSMHFERPDTHHFPCLQLAYDAFARGGNMPCVLNAANEVANLAFRQGRISFPQIADLIARALAEAPFEHRPTLEAYIACDNETRQRTARYIDGTASCDVTGNHYPYIDNNL